MLRYHQAYSSGPPFGGVCGSSYDIAKHSSYFMNTNVKELLPLCFGKSLNKNKNINNIKKTHKIKQKPKKLKKSK